MKKILSQTYLREKGDDWLHIMVLEDDQGGELCIESATGSEFRTPLASLGLVTACEERYHGR